RVEEVESGDAFTCPGSRVGGAEPRRRVRQAGSEVRQAADLSQATGIGPDRNLDQPGALAAVDPGEQRQIEERGERSSALVAVAEPLAPKDHDALRADQELCSVTEICLIGPGYGCEPVDLLRAEV